MDYINAIIASFFSLNVIVIGIELQDQRQDR